MDEFTAEAEGILMDGIEVGLGLRWSMAKRWLQIHEEEGVVMLVLTPPTSGPHLRCHQEFALAKTKPADLRKLGKSLGNKFVAFMRKYQGSIEASK